MHAKGTLGLRSYGGKGKLGKVPSGRVAPLLTSQQRLHLTMYIAKYSDLIPIYIAINMTFQCHLCSFQRKGLVRGALCLGSVSHHSLTDAPPVTESPAKLVSGHEVLVGK